jgi:SAM-dependent methyltransferase
MSRVSFLKRQREAFLDRHSDIDDWFNRFFSAATYALWLDAKPLMTRACRGLVFDAGSGRGAWRRRILATADACESIDHDPRGGDASTWVGDLAHMPQVPEARYDTVVCHQVLEHLPQPGRALVEIRRVLRIGGRVILTAPHLSRLHELPHDYFRYTPAGVRVLLEQAGFIDIEVGTYGGPLSFLHHQASFILPGLVAGIPLIGHAVLAINAVFSWTLARLDLALRLGRLMPLGVHAVASKPA